MVREHPGVADVVVLYDPDASPARALTACVVGGPPVPSTDELVRFAAGQLPQAMVPTTFVSMESFPVTPNGKIDRIALAGRVAEADVELDPPQVSVPVSETAQLLRELWVDLLGVGQIGLDDDFFEMGGHSLLVTEMISRLRDEHGIELPLRAVLERPTIAEIAHALDPSPA